MSDMRGVENELRKLAMGLTGLVKFMEDKEKAEGGPGNPTGRAPARSGRGESFGGQFDQKVLKNIENSLKDATGAMADGLRNTLSTFEGVNEHMRTGVHQRNTILKNIYRDLEAGLITPAQANEIAMRDLQHGLDAVNTPLSEAAKINRKVWKEMEKELRRVNRAADLASGSLREVYENNVRNTKTFAFATAAAKELYDVTVAAAKTGGEITAKGVIVSKALGMSQAELITTTSQFNQTMGASGATTDEFQAHMLDTSKEMLLFTGSLADGGKYAAENAKLFRLAGADMEGGLDGFMGGMNDSFKNLQSMTGMTAEQFTKMNEALLMSTEVQANMFLMNKKDYALNLQTMTQRREALVQGGLMAEQADAVIKGMEGMSGKTAKDRLKDAAKLQASLGAMGMGAEGKEAADIMRQGSRASPEDKARLEQIMLSANKESARRGGGSLQGEMVQDMLNGMVPMMGKDSPMANAITQVANAMKEVPPQPDKDAIEAAWQKAQDDAQSLIIATGDIAKGLANSNIGTMVAMGMQEGFAMLQAQGLFDRMGGPGGAGGGAPGGGAGRMGKLLMFVGRFLGVVGLAVTVFTAAYYIGKKLGDLLAWFFPNLSTWFGDMIWNTVEWIKKAGPMIWEATKALPGLLWDGLSSLGTTIWEFAKSVPGMWVDMMKFVYGGAWDFGKNLVDKIGGGLTTFFNWLKDLVPNAIKELKDKIMSMIPGANLIGDAGEAYDNAKNAVAEKAGNFWGGLKDMVGVGNDESMPVATAKPLISAATALTTAAAELTPTPEELKRRKENKDAGEKLMVKLTEKLIEVTEGSGKMIADGIAATKKRAEEEKEEADKLEKAVKYRSMRQM